MVNASSPPPPSAPSVTMEIPKSVIAFDETIIDGKLKQFVTLTAELNAPVVAEQVCLLLRLYYYTALLICLSLLEHV